MVCIRIFIFRCQYNFFQIIFSYKAKPKEEVTAAKMVATTKNYRRINNADDKNNNAEIRIIKANRTLYNW